MRKSLSALTALLGALCSARVFAGELTGPVVGITDGDTLAVYTGQRQVTIRLAEIDAPEKRQAFGDAARRKLARLCFGTTASVSVVDQDRYGRTLGRVHCGQVD